MRRSREKKEGKGKLILSPEEDIYVQLLLGGRGETRALLKKRGRGGEL